jgi:hypothetical protein
MRFAAMLVAAIWPGQPGTRGERRRPRCNWARPCLSVLLQLLNRRRQLLLLPGEDASLSRLRLYQGMDVVAGLTGGHRLSPGASLAVTGLAESSDRGTPRDAVRLDVVAFILHVSVAGTMTRHAALARPLVRREPHSSTTPT